jgi:hypothetical protein
MQMGSEKAAVMLRQLVSGGEIDAEAAVAIMHNMSASKAAKLLQVGPFPRQAWILATCKHTERVSQKPRARKPTFPSALLLAHVLSNNARVETFEMFE